MTPSQVKGGHDYPFYAEMEKELVKQIRAVGFMEVKNFRESIDGRTSGMTKIFEIE